MEWCKNYKNTQPDQIQTAATTLRFSDEAQHRPNEAVKTAWASEDDGGWQFVVTEPR